MNRKKVIRNIKSVKDQIVAKKREEWLKEENPEYFSSQPSTEDASWSEVKRFLHQYREQKISCAQVLDKLAETSKNNPEFDANQALMDFFQRRPS